MLNLLEVTLLACRYAYFFRFDILLAALLFLFAWKSGPGESLADVFGGMFDLSPGRAAFAAFGATLLYAAFVTTADLVFSYGRFRFGIIPLPGRPVELPGVQLEFPTVVWGVVLLAPFVTLMIRMVQGGLRGGHHLVGAIIAGIAAGAVTIAIPLSLRYRIAELFSPLALIFGETPAGYLDEKGDLYPGHITAAMVAAIAILLYFFAGWRTGVRIKTQPKCVASQAANLPIPSLVWIIGLFVIAVWTLGGAAFWCDRFPFSVVLTFVVILIAFGFTLGRWLVEPHTYHAFPLTDPAPAPVPQVLLARAPNAKAVVVCASGGGIHAAAWTAQVLESLEAACPGFSRHVILTSSVSGGSVGCFYFLASFDLSPRSGCLFDMASESSLDYAAWGFAFRDLVRYFVPVGNIFKWGNRAWALERAWRRFCDWDSEPDKKRPLNSTLDQWKRDASDGRRPGAVFNATLVETGERLAISTVALSAVGEPKGGREFSQVYPHHTIRAATAAGLSAAFPFVTPAANIWTNPADRNYTAIPDEDRYHVVDGGYYDNYGLVSALEFIETGLSALLEDKGEIPSVLLVRIEGSADVPAKPEANPDFLFQTIAPLKTMFSMRSTSQRVRNETELVLLENRWAATIPGGHPVSQVQFKYPLRNAPLSWHLTAADKTDIRNAVTKPEIQAAIQQVCDFLGKPEPALGAQAP